MELVYPCSKVRDSFAVLLIVVFALFSGEKSSVFAERPSKPEKRTVAKPRFSLHFRGVFSVRIADTASETESGLKSRVKIVFGIGIVIGRAYRQFWH